MISAAGTRVLHTAPAAGDGGPCPVAHALARHRCCGQTRVLCTAPAAGDGELLATGAARR